MMLKIVEIFQQKGIDHKTLLITSCSIYSFLIWVSETNQKVLFKIRPDIWMLKYAEIFQDFSKNFTQLKIFVAHVNVSYSSYLKWLKLSNCQIVCSIRGARNYFLCKAPIYLPIEDIKPFSQISQNGWSVQTWEPWLTISMSKHAALFPQSPPTW